MTHLDDAKRWIDAQLTRLQHIEDLSQQHDQQPHLRDLLGELLNEAKAERKRVLKREREDLYRMALMRLFAGFEADFRKGLLRYLVRRGGLKNELEKMLPDAISAWLAIYHVLEPKRFSRSQLGQINRIRDDRNRLAHGGFHQEVSYTSPSDIYTALKSPLNALELPASS